MHDLQEEQATTAVITVEHGSLQLKATLPEVFAALAPVLPIANKLFGSKKDLFVNSRDLHAALELARDHSTWVSGLVKQYNLVEGQDYLCERLNKHDQANWPAIKANGGKVPIVFLFPAKLAAQIASFTRTPKGQMIWRYMYAVVDAAHDTVTAYYQRQLAEQTERAKNAEIGHATAAKKADEIAKHYGFAGRDAAECQRGFDLKRMEADANSTRVSAKGMMADQFESLIQSAVKDLGKAKSLERVKTITEGTSSALEMIQQGNLNVRTWY